MHRIFSFRFKECVLLQHLASINRPWCVKAGWPRVCFWPSCLLLGELNTSICTHNTLSLTSVIFRKCLLTIREVSLFRQRTNIPASAWLNTGLLWVHVRHIVLVYACKFLPVLVICQWVQKHKGHLMSINMNVFLFLPLCWLWAPRQVGCIFMNCGK